MTQLPEPRLNHVLCQQGEGLHRMAYWEWGDPANDQVLLCVHGLTRSGRDFDTLAQTMAGEYRVVAPDLLGRGQSDWLPNPQDYLIPNYMAHMVTLLARLNARRLHWVGTSLGGLIGIGVASLAGSPVSRFVINDVGPMLEDSALRRIGSYVGLNPRFPHLEAAFAYLGKVSASFGPHSPEQWAALNTALFKQDADGQWIFRYDPNISVPLRASTPEGAAQAQAMLWAAWDTLRLPTLLLRGAESDLLTAETAQAMAERGPRSPCVTFPGVGHAPTLMQADQVQVVRDFLLAP